MKTILKILKTFFISVAILIAAIIFLCIIFGAKESKEKKAQAITPKPELLIAPATATEIPTRAPSSTPIGAELSLTLEAFSKLPTPTPTKQIRNVLIPIYNGNNELIGYAGNNPTAAPEKINCTIKGNVSWRNNNEKIYHCPNWRDYNRTEINPEDGDRWFCTEQEAIAAGFRKPKNVSSPCIP